MNYRDDRDALRGRVENLEQELAYAREKAEGGKERSREQRMAELEAQIAEGRHLLDRMRVELAALRGRPRRRSVRLVGAIASSSFIVGAGLALALLKLVGPAPTARSLLAAPPASFSVEPPSTADPAPAVLPPAPRTETAP